MSERVGLTVKKPEVNRDNSDSRMQRTNHSQSVNPSVDRILFLQRTVGNQAVQRLMKSKALQAKLRIGQPGDKYEQEADRVADAVMRMPEPGVQRQVEEEEEDLIQTKPLVNQITPFVQRQVEEEEEILQTKKREGTTPEVTHDLESSINALKGGGQPLAESTRNFFEPRFGYNFSDVRVHTDAKAGESAQAVNALAFTMGRDIVFGMGEYALETSGGLRLLAHELTHVQQQTGKNQSKIIQASPGNEKLNIGDTENETNALIKNASDVIERGGGVAKFEYLPADLEWESSFIWFDDSHVQKLYRYLFKKWFGDTRDESRDTTPDRAVPPRWVGEFRAKALNVRHQKTGNNDDPAYREEKQLAELAVKLADSIAAGCLKLAPSKDGIDAQREKACYWANEALSYGIEAHRVDSNDDKRVGGAILLEIFKLAYGDTSKYHEKVILYKLAGTKAFVNKDRDTVQRDVADRMVEWCGIFAVYVLKKAGVPIGNWNSNLHSLLCPIEPGTFPKKGDIAYRTEKGHMAVVTDVKKKGENTMITTVNGNSDGGRILRKTESITEWNGFYDLGSPKLIKQTN